MQVETGQTIEAIASVDGIDGLFIGPADLAASLGYPGESAHPKVITAIERAIGRIRTSGKPAGILTPDAAFATRCIELGTTFTAVAIDVAILTRGAEAVARAFKAR